MFDLNTALKSEFLRFLYSILVPGIIFSSLLIYSLITNFNDKFNVFFQFSKTGIYTFIYIFCILTTGFIIEIVGVYIESKYIDPVIEKDSKYFIEIWHSYLNINSSITSSFILVQYYRTILTKFKFLLNLTISLTGSMILIILNSLLLKNKIINLCNREEILYFIIIIFICIIINVLSFKRAKDCSKILHESRITILKLYNEINSKNYPS